MGRLRLRSLDLQVGLASPMTPAFPEPYRVGQMVIVRRGDRVGMVGRIVAALPRGIYAVATEGYLQPTSVHHADLYPMARAAKGRRPI